MTQLTVATFNVKNLIGAREEYYRFEEYTDEEHAWKKNWLARQLLAMNADVVCFQEIFDEEALWEVIDETNTRGAALNTVVIPDASKKYKGKAIFRKLGYEPYTRDNLRWVRNVNDGEPGHRRPGLAILSRNGFVGDVESIQELAKPLTIEYPELGGGDAGNFTVTRLSRPILKARVPVGDKGVTVFNIHFKSKLGEYLRAPNAPFPPEADLLNYDPLGRAMGELRAANRRMAEATVLRREILDALDLDEPVMAMGDFNDSEHSVTSAIVTGEKPFKNYAWIRRHDAKHRNDRYTDEENEQITRDIERVRLTSAETHFIKKSLRDMVYTSAFGGVFESIDQILLSRHFDTANPDRIAEVDYLSVMNDHLTDGSHPEAPYNKLASDHGQLIVHLNFADEEAPE